MRAWSAALAVTIVLALAACGGSPAATDAGPAPRPTDAGRDGGGAVRCADDSTCDDGLFCNGLEVCVRGFCAAGEAPLCDDGVACTRDFCSEERGECRNLAPDADGDGVTDAACLDADGVPIGRDCDDADARRFPGNAEVCDAEDHDEDCDSSTFGRLDRDGDGHLDARCCNVDAMGARLCGDDCSDVSASVSPASTEVCDGLDNDCDSMVDEGVGVMLYADVDRDGHGDPMAPMMGCAGAVGASILDDDCDDTNPARHRAQLELCDSVDNDCDSTVDEDAVPVPWYPDLDGDGFGDRSATPVVSCTVVADHSLLGTDCDDANAARHPAAPEQCNAIDDDCNGRADFRIDRNDFEDDDGDGAVDIRCTPLGTDCDDADPLTGAGGEEQCDGRDNDCDSRIDEGAASALWFEDADRDGYGSERGTAELSCAPIPGRVRRAGDCDDSDAQRHPAASEACNGRDDDCDAAADESPAGLACSLANAVAACIGGGCAVARCSVGFADCNGSAADGCEVTLGSTTDCARCGDRCSGRDATYACTAGACAIAACSAGFADCNGDARDGCEARLADDGANCGMCGRSCAAAGARTACRAGACVIDGCDPGLADCDGVVASGCEQSLVTAAHCGACGRACGGAGTTATCDPPGVCRIIGCMGGRLDCNGDASDGCETNPATDVSACGGCGRPCPRSHNSPTCNMGVCGVGTCDAGYGDCDGRPDTGCEQRLDVAAACGSCAPCSLANATAVCVASTCAVGTCQGTWADCNGVPGDGCERDTGFDILHCGACGRACSAPFGTSVCNSGACEIASCNPGRQDCNAEALDGCETEVDIDEAHCGFCGNACAPGSVCMSGSCDAIRQVARGFRHTCVLFQEGGVACWGDGSSGQLGNGTTTPLQLTPVPVALPGPAVAITAGNAHTCAVLSTGDLYCWGGNTFGQLGDGSTTSRTTPVGVAISPSTTHISAGANHTCAINAGLVFCWGQNAQGQVGTGMMGGNVTTPAPVSGLEGTPRAIGAGIDFSCASVDDYGISCWGSNARGQFGDGTTMSRGVATIGPNFFPDPIRLLLVGGRHVCALVDTTLQCWGANDRGQVGEGSTVDRVLPIDVPVPAVIDAMISDSATCAQTMVGSVFCWGDNTFGQGGAGFSGTTPGTAPTRVFGDPSPPYLTGASAVARHHCHGLSPTDLACYGDNGGGQLGAPFTSPVVSPRPVAGL